MSVSLILLAGGAGKRLRSKIPKALSELNGKPLFLYSLERFQKIKFLNEIILVVPAGWEDKFREILKKNEMDKVKKIIAGGRERVDSVYKGISFIKYSDFVFIHDCARPFIKESLIKELHRLLKSHYAVIPAIPVVSTLKYCKQGFVEKTIERRNLYEVQTPQAFRFDIIKRAYEKYKKRRLKKEVWDDSYLVEMLGKRVKFISGDRFNVKLTYPEDLKLAELILKIWP